MSATSAIKDLGSLPYSNVAAIVSGGLGGWKAKLEADAGLAFTNSITGGLLLILGLTLLGFMSGIKNDPPPTLVVLDLAFIVVGVWLMWGAPLPSFLA